MDELTPEELTALSQALDSEGGGSSENKVEEATILKDSVEGEMHTISHAQFLQLEEVIKESGFVPAEIEKMFDVKVHVEVILGSTKKKLEDILAIQEGSVIELEKLAGEPVDMTVNGKVIARGEVVVIDDNFGVKVLHISGIKQKLHAVT